MHYFHLIVAILCEVTGTMFLKQSEGFTRAGPTLVTAIAYALAFYFLSITLKTIPTGVAYAIWSGVGVVLIAAAAWVFQGQRLDPATLLGMAMIVAGVVVINLAATTPH